MRKTDTATPPRRFVRAYPGRMNVGPGGDTLWFAFRDGALLLLGAGENGAAALPRNGELNAVTAPPDEPLFLGTLGDAVCLARELPADAPLPEGWESTGLRTLFGRLDDDAYAVAGYASQMLHWRRTSRFCSACGGPMENKAGDWGRQCAVCGHGAYPAVHPAVLALVHDGGDRILLTHKPGWGKRYSILAGFVEPGESLEECVAREVEEEAGVRVEGIVYAGSQPWPYPSQLMVGFTCRWAGGDIRIDDDELDDARWFPVDDLPELPGALSLSRQLIDAWVRSRRGNPAV